MRLPIPASFAQKGISPQRYMSSTSRPSSRSSASARRTTLETLYSRRSSAGADVESEGAAVDIKGRVGRRDAVERHTQV
ncbi:MAG: hypothetical protein M3434_07105 [Gemmatimonadota bacterium]|nr:hypothetical protein [Gemmatimonadota bacterium]